GGTTGGGAGALVAATELVGVTSTGVTISEGEFVCAKAKTAKPENVSAEMIRFMEKTTPLKTNCPRRESVGHLGSVPQLKNVECRAPTQSAATSIIRRVVGAIGISHRPQIDGRER